MGWKMILLPADKDQTQPNQTQNSAVLLYWKPRMNRTDPRLCMKENGTKEKYSRVNKRMLFLCNVVFWRSTKAVSKCVFLKAEHNAQWSHPSTQIKENHRNRQEAATGLPLTSRYRNDMTRWLHPLDYYPAMKYSKTPHKQNVGLYLHLRLWK